MSKRPTRQVIVRNTRPDDFEEIERMCRRIYPEDVPWDPPALANHLRFFPQGQFVAEHKPTQKVVGMAASLIIQWDDYEIGHAWHDFTDHGFFTNHNPAGQTLYGADIMVDPQMRGMGIGKLIYRARSNLCRALRLRRIRAGARLRGYHQYADQMTAEEYVIKVINRQLGDPTLSFQLKQGFRVIAVVEDYLPDDPDSRGAAAVIEWINHHVAQRRDFARRDRRFGRRRKKTHQP